MLGLSQSEGLPPNPLTSNQPSQPLLRPGPHGNISQVQPLLPPPMAPSLLFLMICSNLLFLLSVETRGSSRWFIHYLLTYLLTAVSIAITVLQATKKKYRHTSHSRAPPYLNPNRDTHACRRQTSQTHRNMKLPVHRVVWVAFGLSSTSTPKFGCLLQQFRMGMATVVTCKVPSGIDFPFRHPGDTSGNPYPLLGVYFYAPGFCTQTFCTSASRHQGTYLRLETEGSWV